MRTLMAIAILGAVLAIGGCYGKSHLRTSYLEGTGSINGTFDVIYYGGRFRNDPASMVVLDIVGDGYTFEPFASKDAYKIDRRVSAGTAIERATAFLKQHDYYTSSEYREIHAPDGALIGYEIVPQYELQTYPYTRINVNYYIKTPGIVKFLVQEPPRDDQSPRLRNGLVPRRGRN